MPELQLDTLESKGLIRLAAIDPELEYLFRHALVQDAAYESLLKQERRALHRQVGDALEQLYPERHGELAAVLARHFEQAGEGEKAIDYLAEAANYANERNALVEAYELFGRAQALMPQATPDDTPELRRKRLEIGFGRVRSGFSFLTEGDQLGALEPMIEEAERLGDLRLIADVRLHDALLRMFHGQRPATSPQLAATFARVAEIARELNDPVISALPRSIVGIFQVFSGDLREGVESLQEAAPLLEQKHDFVGSSFALMALGVGLARLGRFDEAVEVSDRAAAVARDGDVIARIDAMIGRSMISSARGDYEAAVPLAQECTRLAGDSGAAACVVSSSYVAGDSLMRQKRYADAKIEFERSGAISDLTNDHMFRPVVSASMHSIAASMGQAPFAGRSFDEALDEARQIHDQWAEANVLWKRAETELSRDDGDRERTFADFATVVESFKNMGARPYQARALRDWGNAMRAAGQIDEGNDKLSAALVIFDQLGLRRESDEVRATLEAAS